MSHSPSPSNDSTTPIGEATTNQTVRAQANQNEQVQQTATPVQNANGTENATMLTEEDVMNAKLTSVVWKDFKRIRVDGMLKAKCNYCNKLLGGGSNHGTSHLRTHTSSGFQKRIQDRSQKKFGSSHYDKREKGYGCYVI
ncbi:hypothetical protein LINPERHAP1_LOCUS30384 [Linum perenne]